MSLWTRFTWILLLHYVNTVSCLVNIKGFIGDNMLLPCVYPGKDPPPQMLNVYWRDKDDKVVLDIISGVQDLKSQSNDFRGRVISFSDQYWKGNFSIVLQNVQESDTGVYECNIPAVDLEDGVQLNVAGKRVGTVEPAAENAAVTLNASLLALLSVLLTLLSYPQILSCSRLDREQLTPTDEGSCSKNSNFIPVNKQL